MLDNDPIAAAEPKGRDVQTSKPLDGRFATLDLLRLAAALAVVGFHYLFRGAAGEPMMDVAYPEAAPVAIYGYLGVHLFFIISGFVISYSAEGRDWRAFSIARFARLYPAFVLCMTATFLVLLVADHPQMSVGAAQYVANLAILSPALGQPFVDGVYWSIVLEVVFYGWVALALFLGVFERWKLQLVTGWLALAALNEIVLGSGLLRLVLVTEYAPWFAGGVLLQHMSRHGRSAEAVLLFAASFLLSCAMLPIGRDWMLGHYGQAVPLAALLGANLLIHGLAIGAVVARDRLATTPTILALGGLTYPLYLLHQNIGYVAIERLAPLIGRWEAALALTIVMIVVSLAIFSFFETPARRATARLATKLADVLGRLVTGAWRRRETGNEPAAS